MKVPAEYVGRDELGRDEAERRNRECRDLYRPPSKTEVEETLSRHAVKFLTRARCETLWTDS